MKPIDMNIVLDVLHNTLHLEDCLYRNKNISEYFVKSQTQSEIDFLFTVVSYLVKVENNLILEICPCCLGKKFDLLSDFNNFF